MNHPIRLAGCVITDSQNRILLIHRNKNGKEQWETPGGKVEPHEADTAAAVRELQEEIGLTVAIDKKIGEGEFAEGETLYHYVWFHASLPKAELHLEPGFDQYAYYAPQDLHATDLHLSAGTRTLLKLYY